MRSTLLASLASLASIAFLSIGCATPDAEIDDPQAGEGFEGVDDSPDTVMDDG